MKKTTANKWLRCKILITLAPLLIPILSAIFAFFVFGASVKTSGGTTTIVSENVRATGVCCLIFIFGLIYSIAKLQNFFEIMKSLGVIKKHNLKQLLEEEFTLDKSKKYTITNSFAIAHQRGLCIPIERITSMKDVQVNYSNSISKGSSSLRIWVDGKKRFNFFHYNGPRHDQKHSSIILECAYDIIEKNPAIQHNLDKDYNSKYGSMLSRIADEVENERNRK